MLEISEHIGALEVCVLGTHLCGHVPMLTIPIPSYRQIAMGRTRSLALEGRCAKRGKLRIQTALAGQPGQLCYVAMMSQIHDVHYVTARYGYLVRGNRRVAFIGCGEKTAKSEAIVMPTAIQMRSPVGESQCRNNERERSRGGGNGGENEIGGAVCP